MCTGMFYYFSLGMNYDCFPAFLDVLLYMNLELVGKIRFAGFRNHDPTVLKKEAKSLM